MSLTALATLSGVAAEGSGFQAPTPQEFYLPLIGDGPWAFTRPSAVILISVGLLAWWLIGTTRRSAVVPGKGQWVTEGIYNFVRNGVARDIIGSKDFLRFLPLLFSLFTLILLNNLFSVIPPIQYPTMGRVAFPIALTLIVFVVYHFLGIKRHGLVGYFKALVPAGLPTWIIPMIFILEIFTFFVTRPLTLALRLFGNMFAGHMLLLLFITGGEYMTTNGGAFLKVAGGGSFILAFVMTVFEILIEVLQAYIFTLLAATYIAGALADEH